MCLSLPKRYRPPKEEKEIYPPFAWWLPSKSVSDGRGTATSRTSNKPIPISEATIGTCPNPFRKSFRKSTVLAAFRSFFRPMSPLRCVQTFLTPSPRFPTSHHESHCCKWCVTIWVRLHREALHQHEQIIPQPQP